MTSSSILMASHVSLHAISSATVGYSLREKGYGQEVLVSTELGTKYK